MRFLCLGNRLLADDALGEAVWRGLQPVQPAVYTEESGFNLLDYLTGPDELVIVDTIETGTAPPGTIHVFREREIGPATVASPHALGLFETLALARELGLETPRQTTVIAVEAADCSTVGGPMHPAVEAAVPRVVEQCMLLAGEARRARQSL